MALEGAELDDEFSYLPTPGIEYPLEMTSLLALFQIRPRIPDSILTSGTFLTWKAEVDDEDSLRIHRYFNNSKRPHHVQIKNILRIVRVGDVDPHPLDQGPRKMLFHGTREKNIGDILYTGFLPARSQYNGGIYFADRVAMSIDYCPDYEMTAEAKAKRKKRNGGWLFLCEVLLGKTFESHDWSNNPPQGYDSIKRPGISVPDDAENETGDDGCVWPVGKTVKDKDSEKAAAGSQDAYFPYSEYIVYHRRQARPKYLIEWERIPLKWTNI